MARFSQLLLLHQHCVIASATAFLLSELADLAVYTPLQKAGLGAGRVCEQCGWSNYRQRNLPLPCIRQPGLYCRTDRREIVDGIAGASDNPHT